MPRVATKTGAKNRLSMSEARKLLAELVQLAAYQGQEFTITRNGKPMAKIVPVDQAHAQFAKRVRATITESKDILRGLE